MILCGDARHIPLADKSVHCVVTSPPYFGLRRYGASGEIGLEKMPEEYITNLVAVFREVRRVMRDDATLWVNIGDSYWGGKGQSAQAWSTAHQDRATLQGAQHQITGMGETRPTDGKHPILKPKDLMMIPARVALALQADGWWLRSEIVWHKPNPMPESVKDRPTRSHEMIYLLTKSERYYYDAAAIAEPVTESSLMRLGQDIENQEGSNRGNGGMKTNGPMKAVCFGGIKAPGYGSRLASGNEWKPKTGDHKGHSGNVLANGTTCPMRNARDVWTMATSGYKAAHFATFPAELARRCILAGCPIGGIVLDPFSGSGTTCQVAIDLGRQGIGTDLQPEYLPLAIARAPLLMGG